MAKMLPTLVYVDMKASRAQVHLETLKAGVRDWLKNPYSVSEHTYFERKQHVFRIHMSPIDPIIPMSLGDFVCCLRSALDQLAWNLAHTDRKRTFTEKEERDIQFPISKCRDDTYLRKRSLFPSTIAAEIDNLQPYLRGAAYRDDPLWQLNELWTMDKHRAIPMNSNSLDIGFATLAPNQWRNFVHFIEGDFEDALEVRFPIEFVLKCAVQLKPTVSVQVLFGELMGKFEVSLQRMSDINDFVTRDVIPRFTGFFANRPATTKPIQFHS